MRKIFFVLVILVFWTIIGFLIRNYMKDPYMTARDYVNTVCEDFWTQPDLTECASDLDKKLNKILEKQYTCYIWDGTSDESKIFMEFFASWEEMLQKQKDGISKGYEGWSAMSYMVSVFSATERLIMIDQINNYFDRGKRDADCYVENVF